MGRFFAVNRMPRKGRKACIMPFVGGGFELDPSHHGFAKVAHADHRYRALKGISPCTKA